MVALERGLGIAPRSLRDPFPPRKSRPCVGIRRSPPRRERGGRVARGGMGRRANGPAAIRAAGKARRSAMAANPLVAGTQRTTRLDANASRGTEPDRSEQCATTHGRRGAAVSAVRLSGWLLAPPLRRDRAVTRARMTEARAGAAEAHDPSSPPQRSDCDAGRPAREASASRTGCGSHRSRRLESLRGQPGCDREDPRNTERSRRRRRQPTTLHAWRSARGRRAGCRGRGRHRGHRRDSSSAASAVVAALSRRTLGGRDERSDRVRASGGRASSRASSASSVLRGRPPFPILSNESRVWITTAASRLEKSDAASPARSCWIQAGERCEPRATPIRSRSEDSTFGARAAAILVNELPVE